MLDGSGKFTFGGTSSATVALTCTLPGNVICVSVEVNGTPVSGITGGGVTFSRRTPSHSSGDFIEFWHGYSAGVFDDDIVIDLTGGVSFVSVHAWGINGCPSSDYFAIASPVTDESSPCDPLTISSTEEAATCVIAGWRIPTETPTQGSGYTKIFGADYHLTEYQDFASIQTSLSVTVGTGVGTSNGGWADVLKLAASAPTVTDFNTTETVASNATGIVATGTNLSSATAKITQDAVDISQTVTATSATTVTNSIVGWATGGAGRYSAVATTYTATTGAGSSTPLAITVTVPSGKGYVVATSAGGADWQVEGSPEIAIDDEIEFDTTSSKGSTIAINANLSVSETGAVDHTPDALTFTPVTGASLSAVTASSVETIVGADATFSYRISDGVWGTAEDGVVAYRPAITVTGGEYRINGGTWTSAAGTVGEDDTVEARGTASGSSGTETIVSVFIDSDEYQFSITTAIVPPTIVTTTLSAGAVALPYSRTVSATGDSPFTWDITVGVLPGGLSLNTSTGAITGTPTTEETQAFTIRATNAGGNDTQALSITIGAEGSISSAGKRFARGVMGVGCLLSR